MAWSFVNLTTGSATGTTFTLSMGTPAAGNTLIALASWGTDTFSSISDNLGNSYTQIGTEYTPSANTKLRVYYAKNIIGGVGTLTFFFTSAISGNASVSEYSGLSTTAPYDNSYANNEVSVAQGSFNCGTATTSLNNNLLWGYVETPVTQAVGESSWTQRSTFNGNLWSDKNGPTAGGFAFVGTLSPSDTFDGWTIAFTLPSTTNVQTFKTLTGAGNI